MQNECYFTFKTKSTGGAASFERTPILCRCMTQGLEMVLDVWVTGCCIVWKVFA